MRPFNNRFKIHSGAKDNFVVDGRSGVLSVAPDANLDIQRSGDTYDIQVCTKIEWETEFKCVF